MIENGKNANDKQKRSGNGIGGNIGNNKTLIRNQFKLF